MPCLRGLRVNPEDAGCQPRRYQLAAGRSAPGLLRCQIGARAAPTKGRGKGKPSGKKKNTTGKRNADFSTCRVGRGQAKLLATAQDRAEASALASESGTRGSESQGPRMRLSNKKGGCDLYCTGGRGKVDW